MSDSSQDIFDRVAELAELYLLDEISDEQFAELESLMRDHEEAAQAMRTVLSQFGTMRVLFSEQRQFANRIGEVDRDEYLAMLQTLSPSVEPEPVHLVGQLKTHRPLWQHWPVVIPSAIAALLAISVTLIIALSGSESAPSIADNTPVTPAESAPPILLDTPVATLTATHNAQWNLQPGEDIRPGTRLAVGQRLSLTAGFAEITTNDGAVAILEAPATIELLDNNNAIRLHAGKLVGICETDSSKGFVVRTEHMDITDLGTIFGVDASRPNAVQAHVIEGEIEVTTTGGNGQALTRRFVVGQAITASGPGSLTLVPFDAGRFVLDPLAEEYRPDFAGSRTRWAGQAKGDLRLSKRELDQVQVFLERDGHVLSQDAVVDVADTTPWTKGSVPGQHRVSAGQRVDVYLVHYDPIGDGKRDGSKRNIVIHYDRPILGVIADEATLRTTDQQLGVDGVVYSDLREVDRLGEGQRGLDINIEDTLTITNNGMSIILTCDAKEYLDEVRVLVRAKDPIRPESTNNPSVKE